MTSPWEKGKCYIQKKIGKSIWGAVHQSFTSVPGENTEQAIVETIYRYMKTRGWFGAADMNFWSENRIGSARLFCMMKWLSLCTRREQGLPFTLTLARLSMHAGISQIRAWWTGGVDIEVGGVSPEPSGCKGCHQQYQVLLSTIWGVFLRAETGAGTVLTSSLAAVGSAQPAGDRDRPVPLLDTGQATSRKLCLILGPMVRSTGKLGSVQRRAIETVGWLENGIQGEAERNILFSLDNKMLRAI